MKLAYIHNFISYMMASEVNTMYHIIKMTPRRRLNFHSFKWSDMSRDAKLSNNDTVEKIRSPHSGASVLRVPEEKIAMINHGNPRPINILNILDPMAFASTMLAQPSRMTANEFNASGMDRAAATINSASITFGNLNVPHVTVIIQTLKKRRQNNKFDYWSKNATTHR